MAPVFADLLRFQADERKDDIHAFGNAHQFTAAQAQAAEARVRKIKALQNDLWELLSKADALAHGLKTTACDFMSSQLQRAIGTPWVRFFDANATGQVELGNASGAPPALDERADRMGRSVWTVTQLAGVPSSGRGHVPSATMDGWGMASPIGRNALDRLDGQNLHTICSLNALSDILQHRANMLRQLPPLIELRDGETAMLVQTSLAPARLTSSYSYACRPRAEDRDSRYGNRPPDPRDMEGDKPVRRHVFHNLNPAADCRVVPHAESSKSNTRTRWRSGAWATRLGFRLLQGVLSSGILLKRRCRQTSARRRSRLNSKD